jgi:hypothetical protein
MPSAQRLWIRQACDSATNYFITPAARRSQTLLFLLPLRFLLSTPRLALRAMSFSFKFFRTFAVGALVVLSMVYASPVGERTTYNNRVSECCHAWKRSLMITFSSDQTG